MSCPFIKLTCVYPANPMRKPENQNELLMREIHIKSCCILEVTPTVPDDQSLIAKTFISVDYQPGRPFSVMEEAEDILALLKDLEH